MLRWTLLEADCSQGKLVTTGTRMLLLQGVLCRTLFAEPELSRTLACSGDEDISVHWHSNVLG